ncbi:MAG: alkaline phosphatase family protein [Anaerolineae bacterium]|nr:alkaline phosphatase family protein [Anaerolineae bacterium]
MLKKLITLAIIPLILLSFAHFGTMPIIRHSWDQVVKYRSPYTVSLPPGEAGTALVEQVVLVVVDGLREDVSREMPVLNELRGRGASRTLRIGQPSLSHPTWTTIGTGSWQEQSGVTTNWYEGAIRVDSLFARAEAAGLSTAIIGSPGWGELYAGHYGYGRFFGWRGEATDDDILAEALRVLQERRPNLLLVHFEGTDEYGHTYGGASTEYRRVAMAMDDRIAQLAQAVDLGSVVLGVTADHGMIDPGGHGGWEPVVLNVPFVLAGRSIVPGTYPPARQADIAPTLAVLLGTAIPAHSQGQPLWDLLELPEQVRARRAVDVGTQLATFYAAYARQLGARPFDQSQLDAAGEALSRGDYATAYRSAREFADGIQHQAAAAREGRLWRERLGRTPLTLLLLLPFAAWLYLAWRKRWNLRWALCGAAIYFLLYNALFFGRGYTYSLSAFNSEEQIEAFFTQRGVDALLALLVAGLLVGILARREGKFDTALAAGNAMFFVALGLGLQVLLFYWLWDVNFSWYIPNLLWGFKYYLDMLQTTAFYPKVFLPVAAILPFLALGTRWIARRVAPRQHS